MPNWNPLSLTRELNCFFFVISNLKTFFFCFLLIAKLKHRTKKKTLFIFSQNSNVSAATEQNVKRVFLLSTSKTNWSEGLCVREVNSRTVNMRDECRLKQQRISWTGSKDTLNTALLCCLLAVVNSFLLRRRLDNSFLHPASMLSSSLLVHWSRQSPSQHYIKMRSTIHRLFQLHFRIYFFIAHARRNMNCKSTLNNF